MLPASLADDVPLFIATPTSAWARAGASLVPSPVIATRRPPSCSFLISAILSSGVASARKSSTPASSAMARAVSGLSPVIITVRMPIRRISSKRSRMPSLTTSLRWITPRARAGLPSTCSATTSGVPPPVEMASTMAPTSAVGCPPLSRTHFITAAAAPLRICRPPSQVDAGHPGLGGERHERGARRARPRERSRRPCSRLGEHDDRAALRGLVGQAGQLGGVREHRPGRTPATGMNSAAWRLPSVIVPVLSSSRVLTSPAASTARPDIASTLCWTSRSMPAMPIADSSAPIVVGIRQTSSATRTTTRLLGAGVDRERLQGRGGGQEDDGQAGQQDVQRDLVRGLLPAGALDQGDHPVDEALARPGGDLDDDPVREHLGAAGDRAAVAAGLADDRGGLAGDGRLVDAGDALDDVAVAGDHLAGDDHDPVARAASCGGGHVLGAVRRRAAGGRSSRSWRAAAWRPGPCRGPRRPPRPGWRRPRSATARRPPTRRRRWGRRPRRRWRTPRRPRRRT